MQTRIRSVRSSVGVGLLVALFSSVGVADAAPPTLDAKRAAQSFAVGKSAFARGDFSAAGAAFEQAGLYAPHPATLLNAAEAWELAGNNVHAAQLCDRVLDTPELDPRYREPASQQLARIATRIATVDVKVPSGSRVNVEGERDDVVGRRIRMTPGPHTIVVTYPDGETRNVKVSLQAGDTKELDLTKRAAPPPKPEPSPVEEPPKQPKRASGPPTGAWISFGLAAATGGVAAYYGLETVDARDQFDASPTVQTRDDFNSARLFTNVFLGVAVVSAAVGVVLWIAAPSAGKDAPETRTEQKDAFAGTFRF